MEKELEVSDVKTKSDVHRIFAQKCIFNGYNIGVATLAVGFAVIPWTFTKIPIFTRIEKEYKIFFGAISSGVLSYYTADYFRHRCQKKIAQELDERNLGHLLEGIEL